MTTLDVRRSISNAVPKLNHSECIQLFKIFRKYNVKFTENLNGCFINLNNVTEENLKEANEFVEMCLDFHSKNDMRAKKIKEFEEAFESTSKPVYQEHPHHDNDAFSAIKKDKNLNSLEKSIMKENIKNALSEKHAPIQRSSLTPKYTGARARLLKNCRSVSRSNGSSLHLNENADSPDVNKNQKDSFNTDLGKWPMGNKDEIDLNDDVEKDDIDDLIDDQETDINDDI